MPTLEIGPQTSTQSESGAGLLPGMRVSMPTGEFRGFCAGRPVCLLILFLLCTCVSQAEQLPIKTYTTADGLVSNQISRIVRDSRGYLWFCTEDGLSRFDGYTFTNYTTQKGLPTNWVNDFLETRGGIFLVATAAGLCVFDPQGEPVSQNRLAEQPAARPMFTVSRPGANQLSGTITKLFEDSGGNIWCGTMWGLYRVEIVNQRLIIHDTDLGIRSDENGYHRIRSVVEDRDGGLWIATSYELLRYHLDGRTERPDLIKASSDPGLMDIAIDSNTGLWVATRAGLWNITKTGTDTQGKEQFAVRKYARAEGLSCIEMTAVHQDDSGRLWLGTDYGLFEFLKQEKRFRRIGVRDIKEARIWSFNQDRVGNLWIGTADGAIRFARKGFTTFTEADGIGFRDVYHITESSAGEINIYTRFGDLKFFVDKFDGERFLSRKIAPRAFSVQAFDWYHGQIPKRDHLGEWWWPTRQGLFRYGKAARIEDILNERAIAHYTTKDGLPMDYLRGVYEDRRGDIWITLVGDVKGRITRWHRSTAQFHTYSEADGLSGERAASSICEDSSGNLWIGFTGGGVARYREGRFISFMAVDGVPNGEIKQLVPDDQGRVWICASAGGLGRIDDVSAGHPRFTTYTTTDGLASNSILCIAQDRANRFYVGTQRGLNYVDFDTGGIKRFTTNDGLASDEIDVIYRDSRAAFWFGSGKGVSRLSPAAEPPATAPMVFINVIRIAGQPRPISEIGETNMTELTLAPNQNQIEVAFSTPSFATGDPIRYQYRLEGADADWQPLTAQRTVNYANLAAGSYRFLVRAVNADGLISEMPASFPFAILRPVWQRWWFTGIVAALMGLIAYALYSYRVRRLLEIERVRTRIATDLHDDIGSSLSQIAIMSEVIQQQVDGRNPRISHPLAVIAGTSRELVDSMADIVWAINPRHDHLIDLTQRMRQFAADLLTARNIEFHFAASGPEFDKPIETDIRREVFLIFKEAVNNAVRHSNCSSIEIAFAVNDSRLMLKVDDNGSGFDACAAGGGHGLASIKRRAQGIGGTLEILSQPGRGATVSLQGPLRRRLLRSRKIAT